MKIYAGLIAFALFTPVHAVEIMYNADNRPTEFKKLDINGILHDVTVTWEGRAADTYGSGDNQITPFFWGQAAAWDAANALREALIDDGFSALAFSSYLWVPQSQVSGGAYSGPGVYLHREDLLVSVVQTSYWVAGGTVGYTRFSLSPILRDGFED